MHHVPLQGAGPDQGDGHDEVVEGAGPEAGQDLGLGPGFHLEHAHRVPAGDERVHLGVIQRKALQVRPRARARLDEVQGLAGVVGPGQGLERDGGHARGGRGQEFGDVAAGQAANGQGPVQGREAGGDVGDGLVGQVGPAAQGARAPAQLQGAHGGVQAGAFLGGHGVLSRGVVVPCMENMRSISAGLLYRTGRGEGKFRMERVRWARA